jgi:S1-C subfamily serine protease
MKNFVSLLVAGLIGGAVTVGGVKYIDSRQAEPATTISEAAPHQVNATSYGPQVPFDFVEASDRSLDAVVHIKAAESNQAAYQRSQRDRNFDPWSFLYGTRPLSGSGSGVIFTNDGYIVTNNHVVDFADKLEVTLHDGRTFKGYKVGTLPKSDLAVIKINADNLKPITLGNSDDVKVGEWVLAVGNPFDLTSTVTAGIVSAKGRNLNLGEDDGEVNQEYIQTDAAVNPGNSGGALVNVRGDLIGINTAIASPTGSFAGYAFAIPVNVLKPIVEKIIKDKGNFTPQVSLGAVVANIDEMSASDKEEYGITAKSGVVLLELSDGGSAQFAGLLPNDVVSRVNSKQIRNISDLKTVLAQAKVDDVLTFDINREGDYKQMKVKMR